MRNIDKLLKTLEEMMPITESTHEFKFNYYPQSLKKLEISLNGLYPFGKREYDPSLAVVFGGYLGQVMVKNIKGAEWVDFEDDPFDAKVKTPVKHGETLGYAEIFPLLRVYKFLNVDREDTIYGFYNMTQDIANGRLNMDTNGQWVSNSVRGYNMRSLQVSKEQANDPNFKPEDLFNRE